ncbi:MAG: MFS transporter [Pasteurellaceae bacterium]|nr:MFS transporter [Pasteurellaceae bacterium]
MKKEKKNIGLIVASRSISRIGDIMFDFANNTFLAGVNPNSLSLVAIYQSLESVTGVLFNLFGGVIADSVKRKKIIMVTNILGGLACIILAFTSQEKWLIYAIVILNVILAFMSSFSGPSYKAFTKEIVVKEQIAQLNSFLETSSTIVKVTVPILALFLYNKIGINGVLFLDGLSFLIAALLIYFIVPINKEIVSKDNITLTGIMTDLKMGFEYIFSHKNIFMIIALSALVNFFLAAYNLLLPYSNQMFPELQEGLYGIFLTAEAIGGFIGAVLSGFLNKQLSSIKLMIFLGLSGLFVSLSYPLYIAFHNSIILSLSPALFMLFLTIFNIQFFSVVQRDVDNEFLGRVFGIIFTVAILFMPVGTGIFSMILDSGNIFNYLFIGLAVTFLSLIFALLFNKYAID